jgi:hypothetical protein|tara:strand:- start:1961 stop:2104 length:144 start_codon:yes stop_codon:yes gene_type:complete
MRTLRSNWTHFGSVDIGYDVGAFGSSVGNSIVAGARAMDDVFSPGTA